MTTDTPPLCLIAESDIFVAQLLARFAEQAGFATEALSTGQELLDRLPQRSPSLLILDLELPGETRGWEALQMIRGRAEWQDLPILACSWLSQPDAEALAREPLHLLRKPELHYRDFLALTGAAGAVARRVGRP
jgi:CheY-like chemotaxis protein